MILVALRLILLKRECATHIPGGAPQTQDGSGSSVAYHHRLLLRDEVLFEEKLLVIGLIFLNDVIQVHLVASVSLVVGRGVGSSLRE
jgi:hypothetical protein